MQAAAVSMIDARSEGALLPLHVIYEKLEVHSQAEPVRSF
jgi:hypothetical protein